MKNIITRIAPSPTAGFCHLGNVRTLIYNYLLAKKHGGKFFVRLEDTDRDRYTESFLTYFKDMCDWLGIIPDASYWNPDPTIGSFVQSERDYSDKISYLIDNGFAYYAFDSKDDLDALRAKNLKYDSTTRLSMNNSLVMTKDALDKALLDKSPYVIRFAVTPNIDITFSDAVLDEITINSNTLDDKVLLKSNGIGSYHLCNVCDDHDMGVSHVLRGNEWVSSAPFHILLYKAFGWEAPVFAHLPLIMNPDGKGKLSKRTSAKFGIPIAPIGYVDDAGVFVGGWKELGYDPKAFINSLALIGWNPGNDVEIMSIDDMISTFSLDRVNKSGARFDLDKAKWINSVHLRNADNSTLLPFVNIKDDRYTDDKVSKIIDLAKERSLFTHDLNLIVDLFYNDPVIDFKKIDSVFTDVMNTFVDKADSVDFNDIDSLKTSILDICLAKDVKIGKVMPGLRMTLVGGVSGPDLMTTMSILGKDEVCKRIRNSVNELVK